jgi:RNA polymerase sigma-70 factor (ECF subfamily)
MPVEGDKPSSLCMPNSEQVFCDVFEKHSDELFRHCILRLSDRERAVELTQECFLRTWEYVVKGEHITHYRPFLYRVLNNLIIDEYRKHKVQSLDALLEEEATTNSVEGDLLRDEFNLLEEAAIQFDAARALTMVTSLPESYRVVLIMRYINGLSPTEIAECLQENENAVSVRIHRGLRKLRELFSSQSDMTQ